MDEIEEFLRQAAARRNKAQQPQPQQPRPKPQQPAIKFVKPQPVQQPAQRGRVTPTIGSRKIETTQFDQRSAQMGQQERMADERTDSRLHQKFDHQVSDLAGASAQVASAYDDKDQPTFSHDQTKPTKAAFPNIASMFRSPANIQQAIILNEILQRPEHRWQ